MSEWQVENEELNPHCINCGMIVKDGEAGLPANGHRRHYGSLNCIQALLLELAAIQHAARMPDDYPHGLLAWITDLVVRAEGVACPRTEDVEEIQRLRHDSEVQQVLYRHTCEELERLRQLNHELRGLLETAIDAWEHRGAPFVGIPLPVSWVERVRELAEEK